LADYLSAGDCLVFNDTKVMPARLKGIGAGGGAVEVLLLERIEGDRWEVLCKPGRKMRVGGVGVFGGGLLKCVVRRVLDEGLREVEFFYDGVFEEVLGVIGEMPLPPYITQKLEDGNRYQTVYAKHEGAAAAPTAGLHFTAEFLERLRGFGVETAFVTLHTGLGTFRPVKEEIISEHKMHKERFFIAESEAKKINKARSKGKKIVAVGTTSVRTLESAADEKGFIVPQTGGTDIFIYPGYRFKAVGALITNFHLPRSTLIMMVSAFAGRENVLNAYSEAVRAGYRFFSFGDAMLII
jgi:S-adenosylmethionine:tRNA ribosyltransferase-isomerase